MISWGLRVWIVDKTFVGYMEGKLL